jgi:flagellar hook-basal body complex protein FliE
MQTKALAVGGEPNVGLVVFGAGENQVALAVVLDVRNRALVALQQNRSLRNKKQSEN